MSQSVPTHPRVPVVGITGGVGSGKTTAGEYFAQLGIGVVDADVAARTIMEPGRPALAAVRKHFGAGLLCADGTLDRRQLRARVFSEPAQREWLEQLTHPLIAREINAQLQRIHSTYAILVSPLLLEAGQQSLCDQVLVVDAPEQLQLARTMARDNNDEAQVRRIMATQLQRQKRLAQADYILDNSGEPDELRSAVAAIHRQLLARYGG